MEHTFKLFEFNVYNNRRVNLDSDDETNVKPKKDNSKFMIQMFGIDEEGQTASILVEDYTPFFYLKVNNNWGQTKKTAFFDHLKLVVGNYYKDAILECKLIERKKLYGFDAGKNHRFIEIKFTNINIYNKVKNLWYCDGINEDGEKERKLIKNGYKFVYKNDVTFIELYEANIPPLLRFFHIREVSPSGWIAMPMSKTIQITYLNKTTSCDYEFVVNYKNVIPLNDKEDSVPYKIMSVDIEASSSHGDFPVPIKSYKKLATNIVDYFTKLGDVSKIECKNILYQILQSAFGFNKINNIDLVYPKEQLKDEIDLKNRTELWFKTKVRDYKEGSTEEYIIETLFEHANKEMLKKEEEKEKEDEKKDDDSDDESDDEKVIEEEINIRWNPSAINNIKCTDKESTIIDIMIDKKFQREVKINELIRSLRNNFPALEGDKVTFIGSTFMKYGDKDPYLNNCIVLNSCNNIMSSNSQIETYNTEKEVLQAWTKLVQRENPDIIIGYNIFSFDYEFMFRRSQELDCVEDFLKLSRNKDEICATVDYKNPGKIDIDRSSTTLASGTYELAIIKMNGRLQVDMLNWFRRSENLTSYKLDYVGGYFIGDEVKNLLHWYKEDEDGFDITRIETNNMIGLQVESYIHFEEINHSSDYYKNGQKFKVINVCKEEGWFEILGIETPQAKIVKWGLAKDDVTPKDIFRMTNEGPASRAIIAKYCVQDCNLVHYLFNKVDVVTNLIEMSKLCSVPMSFLIFRGQGIKLTSYVAKKCREKKVLMPVIDKGSKNEGYEGAIVLYPKCGLYLDEPVGVGDFASLYPSSMLSENLCPSSKVWTKIYDSAGNLILETGEKDINGIYIYDNLPGIEYVDVRFDTYRYVRKNPKAKAEKIKSGYKECRFAQPTMNEQGQEEKAIMPLILQDLLKARKDTRKLIPQTSDEFMKNVLDKRQLAYKVTANSLYGQLGAKTSTFYEPDIAASTTATGRLLLTFAKRVVEECYTNTVIDSKYGFVNTNAEYVYGDSVANYTPVYIKVDDEVSILTIEQLAEKYGDNNWVNCVEPGKQDKEFCELNNVETWTEKGWTKLFRVIRHILAPHKKMMRVLTHTGCVDVTDDHSLVNIDGTEITPNDVQIGTELLHNKLPIIQNELIYEIDDNIEKIMNFKIPDTPIEKKYKYFGNGKTPECINLEEYEKSIKDYMLKNADFMLDAAKYCYHLRKNNKRFIIETGSKRLPDYKYESILKIEIDEDIYDSNGNCYFEEYQENYNSDYESDNEDIYITKLSHNINEVNFKEEIPYQGFVYDLTTENHHFAAGVGNMIVHNTDSVFFKFNLTDKETGEKIIGEKALELSIEIAQEACHQVSKVLKQPHDFEYEKTYMPFCLFAKKRYSSIKFGTNYKKGKRDDMGSALKRRDNAPIVKDVYGGVIDILMVEKNIPKAIEYVHMRLQELVDGKVPIDKLIISKSLRSFYKNPQSIAHKVLADRIGEREPGNKPTSGDRVPFVYIVYKGPIKNKKILQGERIETPSFIKDNNLQIDYSFYITNQIMKPLLQLFGLVLKDIWLSQKPPRRAKVTKFQEAINKIKAEILDETKCDKKISKLKDKEVEELIFSKYLRDTNNTKNGNQSVAKFFTIKP